MGTHPIFESDFDCLTEKKNENFQMNISNEQGSSLEGCPFTDPSIPTITAGLWIFSIFLTALFVVSILGNITSILAISFGERMQNKANCFIFSLALSDLCSGLVSPIGIYIKTWGFNPFYWPSALCNIYWAIEETTSFVTSLHIASFAVFRYLSVCHPHRVNFERRILVLYLVGLWAISLVCGIYLSSVFLGIRHDVRGECWPQCSLLIENENNMRLYQQIAFPVFYYIPLIVLFSSSFFLARKLIGTNESNRSGPSWRRNQKAVTQLSLVVVSYLIGYLPHIVYFQYTSHTGSDAASQRTDYWLSMAVYICLRLSECMNPFLYNMASTKMR